MTTGLTSWADDLPSEDETVVGDGGSSVGLSSPLRGIAVGEGKGSTSGQGGQFRTVLSKTYKRRLQREAAARRKAEMEAEGKKAVAPTEGPSKRVAPTPSPAAQQKPEPKRSRAEEEEGQNKPKNKTYAEAVEAQRVLWIVKETAGAQEIETVTDAEIDKIFKLLDGDLKKEAEQGRRARVLNFGVSQGMIRIILKDDVSKTVVKGILTKHLNKSPFKLYDQVEMPVYKRYTVWVQRRRAEPQQWMEWLFKCYARELKRTDVRLYISIEKEGGHTLVLGVSERAEKIFREDDLMVFIGAGSYQLRDWRREEPEGDKPEDEGAVGGKPGDDGAEREARKEK